MGDVKELLKKAFSDMKEDAKAQHAVDKANFAAIKAESRVQRAETRAMHSTAVRKEMTQQKRQAEIKAANERLADAERRLGKAK